MKKVTKHNQETIIKELITKNTPYEQSKQILEILEFQFYNYELIDKYYTHLIDKESDKSKLFDLLEKSAIIKLKMNNFMESLAILYSLYKEMPISKYSSLIMYNLNLQGKAEEAVNFFESLEVKSPIEHFIVSDSYLIMDDCDKSLTNLKKSQICTNYLDYFYKKCFINLKNNNIDEIEKELSYLKQNTSILDKNYRNLQRLRVICNDDTLEEELYINFKKQYKKYKEDTTIDFINSFDIEKDETALISTISSLNEFKELIKDKKPYKRDTQDTYLVKTHGFVGEFKGSKTEYVKVITLVGTKHILSIMPVKEISKDLVIDACINLEFNKYVCDFQKTKKPTQNREGKNFKKYK